MSIIRLYSNDNDNMNNNYKNNNHIYMRTITKITKLTIKRLTTTISITINKKNDNMNDNIPII